MMESNYILMVEDNRKDELLALRAFQRKAVSEPVVVVRDGQEALDFLYGEEATKHPPKLIILDLQLPVVDGLQVLEKVKKERQTKVIPVVVFSTSDEPQDIIGCYERGANCYIRKPVEYEELEKVVAQIDSFWLKTCEPKGAALKYKGVH